MSLKDTIKSDLTVSMKAGTKQRTQVLRMLLAEIMSGEKATQQVPADKALRIYHKRLTEARTLMTNEPSKVAELDGEIAVVESYIPKGASKDDVKAFVKTLDLSLPFGDVMKLAKGQFPNEGKLLAETVKELQSVACP